MSLISPVDPSPARVSACPVHFLWDGRGHGRVWVRSGFLGLLAAGALAAAGSLLRSEGVGAVAVVVGGVSGLAWLAGQGLSAAVRGRGQRRA